MILEKVPTSLRGALSRWLLEPKAGVFLGNPSARVRDELWKRAIKQSKQSGSVLQIWSDQNPQGYSYRQFGDRGRTFFDFEGLSLIKKIEHNSDTKA
ncbi:MAG: type I-E CRISPR-associated endoribonuclease Cas2e [Dehalococcoidales bacterium]|nr:type I-E CRISPR-associated endoribonuclease Cas2e [Dehalococcoidales bacterium]